MNECSTTPVHGSEHDFEGWLNAYICELQFLSNLMMFLVFYKQRAHFMKERLVKILVSNVG